MGQQTSRRTWRNRLTEYRSRLRGWLFEHRHGVGLGGPPNNWANVDVVIARPWGGHADNVSAEFHNDAGEIWTRQWWTGEPDSNLIASYDVRAFRRLALWYLWRWAFGEWFGLRRTLFYWDLSRRMKPYRQQERTAYRVKS